MTDRNKLKERARDELFSHINRCGVLQAGDQDREQWLTETMDYLAERYPDLEESDLRELHSVGLAFCRPAIPHGKGSGDGEGEGQTVAASVEDSPTAV